MSQFKNTVRNWLREASHLDEVGLAFNLLAKGKSYLMIDVGAHQGGSFCKFAECGWEVHAFEPDPRNYNKLTSDWSARPNIHLNASAVGSSDLNEVCFAVGTNSYIGSLTAFTQLHTKTINVPLVTLSSYVLHHGLSRIDFLKIDAEGHDLDVLRGCPWNLIKPRLIVCEFEDGKLSDPDSAFKAMSEFLSNQGYFVLISEWYPIISYEGPFRWRRFFEYPKGLPHPNSNGNIVAVRSRGDWNRLQILCLKKRLIMGVSSLMRSCYHLLTRFR